MLYCAWNPLSEGLLVWLEPFRVFATLKDRLGSGCWPWLGACSTYVFRLLLFTPFILRSTSQLSQILFERHQYHPVILVIKT